MTRITFTAGEEHERIIDDVEDEIDAESTSAAVRKCIERADEYADLQRECERLRNQRDTLIQDRQENKELVKYVEEERDLQKRQEERKNAPAWTRFRYWLFGYD